MPPLPLNLEKVFYICLFLILLEKTWQTWQVGLSPANSLGLRLPRDVACHGKHGKL
jgi:hypothetical protein